MATCPRALLARYFQRFTRRSYSTHAAHLQPKKGDKVIVAMSGGVDSSVTARLLADEDYDLSAVFMRNWDTRDETGSDMGCEWKKDWEDVQKVCKMLDIPCQLIDLSREYWLRVFEPSLSEWESGSTPNPDVWCNSRVKFGALLDRLDRPSREQPSPKPYWFATGHYARKSWSSPISMAGHDAVPRPKLMRGIDPTKDQSYFLASVPEQRLQRALFPIGHMEKAEIRRLAAAFDLPTASKEESMGLCFVGERRKFNDFLSSYLRPRQGNIVDLTTSKIVGVHQGLWTYTIGQGAKIGGAPQSYFVADKNAATNTVFVVPGKEHELLYATAFQVKNFQWIWADSPPVGLRRDDGFRAKVKFRYRMDPTPCIVYGLPLSTDSSTLSIQLLKPARSTAVGQVAALYDEDGQWCLGCGIITGTANATVQDHEKERFQNESLTGDRFKDWQWWN